MKIYLRLDPPYEWVRVDESKAGIVNGDSRIEAFGEVQSLDDYILSDDDEVIGVVSGAWVTTHEVELPAKTKKIFNAALPYALEESISEDVENMHFVVPSWKPGQPCNVLALSKDKIAEWQGLANKHQLPITQLIPDHALLPIHDAAQCTVVIDGDLVYARQEGGFGVGVDRDFLDAWIMDVPVDLTVAVNDKALTERLISENPNRDFRHWECGNKLVHWLDYSTRCNINLWGDQYRPNVRRSGANPYSLSLLVLLMVVIGKLGVDAYQYIALKSEISEIKAETQIAFKSALPDFADVAYGQERGIMEQVLSRVGNAQKPVTLHAMLGAISTVVRGQNITINEFTFNEAGLSISCQLSDFSQVDQFTKKLNRNPLLSAQLQSSETDEGKVIAIYQVQSKVGGK